LEGDEAFEGLWRAQFASVARVAAGITGNIDDGADLAQETFARAYQHWNHVRSLDRPEAWLRQVAVRLAISQVRRARRKGAAADRSGAVDPPVAPDEELVRTLHLLTPGQRSVVVLRFYLDLSVEEVARLLHKRPGTVRALTHQAMTRLRSELRKESLDG